MDSAQPSWWLSLDTSENSEVCLAKVGSGKLLEVFEANSNSGSSHSEEITTLINSLLESAGVGYCDLSRLVIGIGPGSFTGLRIGLSFFKGLAFSYRLPLSGVSSFKALGFAYKDTAKLLIALSDARRAEFFVGVYQVGGPQEPLQMLMPPQIVPKSALKSTLKIFVEAIDIKDKAIIVPNIRLKDELGILTSHEIPILSAKRVAAALIEIALLEGDIAPREFSFKALGALQPDYVRAMAAKTIQEREAELAN